VKSHILAQWQTDLTQYQQIITQHFLTNVRHAVVEESLPQTIDITALKLDNVPTVLPVVATVG
jgi:hypothetical protein